jgi:hypothetical protein
MSEKIIRLTDEQIDEIMNEQIKEKNESLKNITINLSEIERSKIIVNSKDGSSLTFTVTSDDEGLHVCGIDFDFAVLINKDTKRVLVSKKIEQRKHSTYEEVFSYIHFVENK